MQLERILHSQGFGSRKECRALIRRGHVTVAGSTVDDPFAEFAPDGLRFSVDGRESEYRVLAYLVLNKPADIECSRSPQHHASVFSLLPPELVVRGVQCVGRLDADTTGLLLLSDDGQFIHRYSSPRRKVPKVYDVITKHPVDAALVASLLAGVELHDDPNPVAAAACEQTGERRLSLTITEGKYHQVKRMVAAAGNRVESLRRVAIGGLRLDAGLAEGSWRWLEPEDIERLGG